MDSLKISILSIIFFSFSAQAQYIEYTMKRLPEGDFPIAIIYAKKLDGSEPEAAEAIKLMKLVDNEVAESYVKTGLVDSKDEVLKTFKKLPVLQRIQQSATIIVGRPRRGIRTRVDKSYFKKGAVSAIRVHFPDRDKKLPIEYEVSDFTARSSLDMTQPRVELKNLIKSPLIKTDFFKITGLYLQQLLVPYFRKNGRGSVFLSTKTTSDGKRKSAHERLYNRLFGFKSIFNYTDSMYKKSQSTVMRANSHMATVKMAAYYYRFLGKDLCKSVFL